MFDSKSTFSLDDDLESGVPGVLSRSSKKRRQEDETQLIELKGQTAYGQPVKGEFLKPETPLRFLNCRPGMFGQVARAITKWNFNNLPLIFGVGIFATHDFVEALAISTLGNSLDEAIIKFSFLSFPILAGLKTGQEALIKPILLGLWKLCIGCPCGIGAEKVDILNTNITFEDQEPPILYDNPNRPDLHWSQPEIPWGNRAPHVARAAIKWSFNNMIPVILATYLAMQQDSLIFSKGNQGSVRVEFYGGLYPALGLYYALITEGLKATQELTLKPLLAAGHYLITECRSGRNEITFSSTRGAKTGLTRKSWDPLVVDTSAKESDSLLARK